MARTKKTITYESTEVIQDADGNVEYGKATQDVRVPVEPPYIKQYIEDITYLSHVPTAAPVLDQLVRWMNYDNEIPISASVKRRIAEALGIKQRQIEYLIKDLVDANILARVDRGLYKANPYLFARGTWTDILKMREKSADEFSVFLNIKYGKNGRQFVSKVVTPSGKNAATEAPDYELEQEQDGKESA